MIHGPPTPAELETAQAIRKAFPGRAVRLTFEALARVYYAEVNVIGRCPQVRIGVLGRALGIERDEAARVMEAARCHVHSAIRVANGGGYTRRGHGRNFRWVCEDKRKSNVVRIA